MNKVQRRPCRAAERMLEHESDSALALASWLLTLSHLSWALCSADTFVLPASTPGVTQARREAWDLRRSRCSNLQLYFASFRAWPRKRTTKVPAPRSFCGVLCVT